MDNFKKGIELMRNLVNSFLLIVCFLLLTFCSGNKRIQFSKKYIPVYNPGGRYFIYDQKFLKSYELYQKRHDASKERITLDVLKIDKKINQYDGLNAQLADSSEFTNNSDTMINSYGIDLARLKGAKFIEVVDKNDSYECNKKHKGKGIRPTSLPQKLKAEFSEIRRGIFSRMKGLCKKYTEYNKQGAIVNFNNYNEVECSCNTPNHVQ